MIFAISPVRDTITGVPQANDSIVTNPKDSYKEGTIKTSEAE